LPLPYTIGLFVYVEFVLKQEAEMQIIQKVHIVHRPSFSIRVWGARKYSEAEKLAHKSSTNYLKTLKE
jgi:hypothetical protein